MKIEIPGIPKPLKRHRFSNGIMYDPSKKDKSHFVRQVISAYPDVLPRLESINVIFEYHMPIPKSYSNKKRLNAIGKPHSKKPDLSNLVKFTEDALNNVLWKDDALISIIFARKIYGEEPKTVIYIEDN